MPPVARTRTFTMTSERPLDEVFLPCAVCGMDVDADRTASPNEEQIVYTTTGTVYHHATATSIDLDVAPSIGRYASCFFAGAPTGLGRRILQC